MQLFVVCLLLLQYVHRCTGAGHPYQHLKDNIRAAGNGSTEASHDSQDKGFMMCAGNHMVPDVLKMIWQLKHQWKSAYGVSVAHCGEITDENQQVLRYMHPEIRILNLCEANTVLGMDRNTARHRLRGFYCKVAAVILSPFPNTMLLDLDVVWFQSPDTLFHSKAYQETGALFFRDRTYPANENHKHDDQVLLDMFHAKDIGVTSEDVERLIHANGFSFFWRFLASQKPGAEAFPQFGDLQDSSVVVLNRAQHPRMLDVMEEMLPSFDYGYGDKEIFWISATLAKEKFTLSPFLAGQYGDCYGVILHYNPDDAVRPASALPLYTNAEFFVEKDLTSAGDFISDMRTPPRLATDVLHVGVNMNTWPPSGRRGGVGCTCKQYPCISVSGGFNQYMLYAQWVTLTMRLGRAGPSKDCVPVKVSASQHLADALATHLKPEHCFFVGCPHLPVQIDTTLQWPSERYCDPVHFERVAPEEMSELAAEARRPNSAFNMPPVKDNTPIQCDTERQLFLFTNGTARPFNSWNAFVSRGFDLDNVVRIPRWQCNNVPVGAPLD